ncbi:MAG: phage major capsid protein [Planctomycetota bacterium]
MPSLLELREARDDAKKDVLNCRDAFSDPDRGGADTWPDDATRDAFDAADKKLRGLDAELRKAEKSDEVRKRFAELEAEADPSGRGDDSGGRLRNQPLDAGGTPIGGDRSKLRSQAIVGWMRNRFDGSASEDDRAAAREVGFNIDAREIRLELDAQRMRSFQSGRRALSTDGGSAGATIPEGFIPRLEQATLSFEGPTQTAEIMTTATANDLPYPMVNNTANVAGYVDENTDVADAPDQVFTQKVLGARKITSGLFPVSHEIMRDSAFNIGVLAPQMLGEQIGRFLNEKLTNGTGSGEMEGLVTAAVSGKVAGSATVITFDDVIDLIYSVDPSYRNRTGFALMMHDGIQRDLMKIKDSDGNYLWQPSNQAGQPPTVRGRRIVTNQHMADAAVAGATTMLAGDLSMQKLRLVRGMRTLMSTDFKLNLDQTVFVSFLEGDARVIDAGTNPIKKLVQAP